MKVQVQTPQMLVLFIIQNKALNKTPSEAPNISTDSVVQQLMHYVFVLETQVQTPQMLFFFFII